MEINNLKKYENTLNNLPFTSAEQEKIIKQMDSNKYLKWFLDDEYYHAYPERFLIALRMLLKSKLDSKNRLIFFALKHVPFAKTDMSIFKYGLDALMEVAAEGENDMLKVITNPLLINPALENDNPNYRFLKFVSNINKVKLKIVIDKTIKEVKQKTLMKDTHVNDL